MAPRWQPQCPFSSRKRGGRWRTVSKTGYADASANNSHRELSLRNNASASSLERLVVYVAQLVHLRPTTSAILKESFSSFTLVNATQIAPIRSNGSRVTAQFPRACAVVSANRSRMKRSRQNDSHKPHITGTVPWSTLPGLRLASILVIKLNAAYRLHGSFR